MLLRKDVKRKMVSHPGIEPGSAASEATVFIRYTSGSKMVSPGRFELPFNCLGNSAVIRYGTGSKWWGIRDSNSECCVRSAVVCPLA